MKTTYKVIEAHSGTNEKEIAKAKREFLKRSKTGEFGDARGETIEIHFYDVNYCITAEYILPNFGSIGSALIYKG